MNTQLFSIRLLTSFYHIHYQYYKCIMEKVSGLYTVNNRSSEMKKKSSKKHDYDHKELIFTTYLEVCSTELKTSSIHSVTILLYIRC